MKKHLNGMFARSLMLCAWNCRRYFRNWCVRGHFVNFLSISLFRLFFYGLLWTCYSPRDSPQRQGGASVPCRISQSCAGETFGYAALGRSQGPQTFRVDASWYGTRAMQVTPPRGQNCARRAQFCVSALCPLAPTPFEEISRNLVHATRAFIICIN